MINSLIQPEAPGLTKLTEEDFQALSQRVNDSIVRAQATPAGMQRFAREKTDTVAGEVQFLLAQRDRALDAGLPDAGSHYYHLLHRKLNRYLSVLLSFYRVEPGYLFWMQDQAPQVLLWLLTSAELAQRDLQAASLAPLLTEKMPAEKWLRTVSLATAPHLSNMLASAALSALPLAGTAMTALINRGEVTESLASQCIREGADKVAVQARYQLARMGDQAGINWVLEHGKTDDSLFTHLLIRKDKVAWLRRDMMPQAEFRPDVALYGILNRLPESFDLPDFQHDEKAYLKAALAGDPLAVEPMIEALFSAQDEGRQEQWLNAILLILGEQVPVRVADLGVKYDAKQAADLLMQWWQNLEPEAVQVPMMRLGKPLDYASSVDVLRSQSMPAEFRHWVWRELCLCGGIYVAYDPMSWPERQRRAIHSLSHHTTAAERYNQRINDAAVGR
ncbi:hypothetical protein [Photobacterium sp. 1_MG-2023]|uniref:hypothetical protein n=1 Tax=Photobacterium sp. 1_MG-2023 TaxID=3062646 RepID=UPI0026E2711B|nr:hypothetical protein [Photobacterium sp. 1_MG-2023]MDO6706067.1 hypothetical protein [Photobacterium sp. 1_MG-2023]